MDKERKRRMGRKKILNSIKQMSGLISSECESLLDLGFGIQETKELLMRSIMEYWGVDYVNRTERITQKKFKGSMMKHRRIMMENG